MTERTCIVGLSTVLLFPLDMYSVYMYIIIHEAIKTIFDSDQR